MVGVHTSPSCFSAALLVSFEGLSVACKRLNNTSIDPILMKMCIQFLFLFLNLRWGPSESPGLPTPPLMMTDQISLTWPTHPKFPGNHHPGENILCHLTDRVAMLI